MSCPVKCPSCGTLLADKHYKLRKILEETEAYNELVPQKKLPSMAKEFEKLGINNICCRSRLTASVNFAMHVQ